MNSSNVESSTCSTQEPSMSSYKGSYSYPHNYRPQNTRTSPVLERNMTQRVTERNRMPMLGRTSSAQVAAGRRTPETSHETQTQQQQQQTTTSASAGGDGSGMMMMMMRPGNNISATTTSDTTGAASVDLLDVVLPVRNVSDDRDNGIRPLGLCVRTGRGGAHNTARLILVRLTDPSDPFFLFELELREEDYAAFKQRLELLVDFNGFPYYLVNMLQGIVQKSSPLHVSLAVHPRDAASATLRVVETTEFRTVEHIALVLVRQGDVGQKRYLAERFQHFESGYRRVCSTLETLKRDTSAEKEALQSEYDNLMRQHRDLQEQLAAVKSEAEKAHLTSVTHMQESSRAELTALRARYDEQLGHTAEEARALQKQLLDQLHEKETALQELRGKCGEREAELLALRSSYRLSQDTVTAQDAELKRLRETNAELNNFKLEATKAMSENELNYVALTERLRAATAGLQSKDDELDSLRAHYEKQDGYIHILSAQNDQLRTQGEKAEKDLEKAHHIIAHQLQTIRNAKERHRLALDQLRSQDTLLQERQTLLQRTNAELAACQEKLQSMQRKQSELKEQLEKNDTVREQLAQELQQTQTALLHMQKSTSLHGRHWAGGGGVNFFTSSTTSPAMTTTTTASGLRGATTSSSYAGLTSSSPSLARTTTTQTVGEGNGTTSVSRQEPQPQRQLFHAGELHTNNKSVARDSEPRKPPIVAAPSQGIINGSVIAEKYAGSLTNNSNNLLIGRGLLSGQTTATAAVPVPASSYF